MKPRLLILIAALNVLFPLLGHSKEMIHILRVTDPETGESKIIPDDPSRREMIKDDTFHLRGGHEVSVYSASFEEGTYVYLNEEVAYALKPEQIVSAAQLSGDASTLVFRVDRSLSGTGSRWYRSLLVIRSIESDGEHLLTISNVMDRDMLKNLFGGRKFSVLKIVDVNEYPELELKVLIYEKLEPPSRTPWFHQRWNVETVDLLESEISPSWSGDDPLINPIKIVKQTEGSDFDDLIKR